MVRSVTSNRKNRNSQMMKKKHHAMEIAITALYQRLDT
jgi:hypothetical protein